MGALGCEGADLDQAYETDRLENLDQKIEDLRKDAEEGGEKFRILLPESEKPEGRLRNFRAWLRQYRDFLDKRGHPEKLSNWEELEEMRIRFLQRATDFVDFEQDSGIYFDVERYYKDEVLNKFDQLMKSAEELDDRTLGSRALELLQEEPANFLSWRTFSAIKDAGDDGQAEIVAAIGEMLHSDDEPAQLVERAARRIEPHLPPRSFGYIRSLVSAPLAFARPDEAVFIKTRIMQRAIRELTGSPLFRQQLIDAEEYGAFLDLMQRIESVMQDEWDWKPWDFWDVQGFLWVVMAEDWEEDDEAAEDAAEAREPVDRRHIGASAYPLNQILYGPPGTGKTWATARIAVEICNGSAPEERHALMAEYERLRSAGRIALTTFHQSLGYEEFVEGLRPVTETDGDDIASGGFRLEPHNGIFREICALAEQARTRPMAPAAIDLSGRQFFKMSLGRAADEGHIYEAAIDGDFVVLGWGGDVDWSAPEFDRYDAILARWQQVEPGSGGRTGNVAQVFRFRATMQKGDIIIVSEGNSRFRAIGEVIGDYEFHPENQTFSQQDEYNHRRAVRWLRVFDESLPVSAIYDQKFVPASCYLMRQDKLNLPAIAELLGDEARSAEGEPSRYVLIIDEINRANVSKVLGELITLIEPDKRLGRENALKVTLPYSKDAFGVPDNLHIIGTMNTADRSIAMLDTALRRRFEFQEMMPNYEPLDRAVAGIHLGDFLGAINRRVEWLFDREHQIGHAYLTAVDDKRALDEAMRRRIIPLLAEYFYEDWDKVRAALNDADGNFIAVETLEPPPMMDGGEEARTRYGIRDGAFPIEGYSAAIA